MGNYTKECINTNECTCPKTDCENHRHCCDCIKRHRESDSLPYCLFPDNKGDKSLENFYHKLKKRFIEE